MTTRIERVAAWEILDSRGRPTVACEVVLTGGARASAGVPSGASTGRHEAHELRDGGGRFGGYGVLRAVANVETVLAGAVVGLDATDSAAVDRALIDVDGSANLERTGANAILAVSLAAGEAASAATGVPLYRFWSSGGEPCIPMPMINIFSGGAHAAGGVDIQDVLVIPIGATSFIEAIEWATRVRLTTAALLEAEGHTATLVADEGGFGAVLSSNRAALELVARAIDAAGLEGGTDVALAVDVAATQLGGTQGYALAREERFLSSSELVEEIASWKASLPLVSVEDPLGEDDWTGWRLATQLLGDELQLVGDDLFATNHARLERGATEGVANAILIKPNQIGTITDATGTLQRAQALGYGTIVSARSGETEHSWVADLAVALRAGQIKIGSTMRGERTSKWNRLLKIEKDLGYGYFAGWHPAQASTHLDEMPETVA